MFGPIASLVVFIIWKRTSLEKLTLKLMECFSSIVVTEQQFTGNTGDQI